jgi:hypothetical protein
MSDEARAEATSSGLGYEGVVTEVLELGRVTVRTLEGASRTARLAVVGYAPAVGDRLLLLDTDRGDTFAIGAVAVAAPPAEPEARLGDTRAVVEGEAIVLRRDDGTVVLRHDPAKERTEVAPAAGDLVFDAPEGDLVLRAGEGAVRIAGRRVALEADAITQDAESVRTTATEVGWSADRWELRVNRIREHAREAFRRIDGLLETRAGRLRAVVRRSAHHVAERTTIRSRGVTSVDGEQVHLG